MFSFGRDHFWMILVFQPFSMLFNFAKITRNKWQKSQVESASLSTFEPHRDPVRGTFAWSLKSVAAHCMIFSKSALQSWRMGAWCCWTTKKPQALFHKQYLCQSFRVYIYIECFQPKDLLLWDLSELLYLNILSTWFYAAFYLEDYDMRDTRFHEHVENVSKLPSWKIRIDHYLLRTVLVALPM